MLFRSELIIKALQGREVHHPNYGHQRKFEHVRHLGNSVAHFLARRSKSSNELQIWIKSILDDLAPLVMRDAL